eukprot:CAMPEP_0202876372 /NCGR_PEP_ID=MMETSP1391-20130828/28870_1 /ASSEMBLY_ACC=CAM_ASM_000867 /TAXON_ID=1034604 /ORGANISM="Chlamydomonas leiostraca, Strain SAG 11-49" /LENGTH=885 /DNA_ID=CAMNT_0049558197 /DNA_START=87 /DNA_END=2741 /DNA_ORIENTATION=+
MSRIQGPEPLEGHPIYEKVRTIGKGQRSFVQVARNKASGELVAIRFIPRGWEPSHTKYVTREILNHQELSLSKHPHIVEFKEVFLTQRYLGEVLEYVEGETLSNFLQKVGGKVIEGLARFIFQQLIIALDFCHRKGKVNRDIKLSNVLLSIAEGQLPLVKLADFGFSKDTYRHSEPHSQVGTALFVAPEVMQNFSGVRYDGQAADVWACGVCAFIMLFGRHPYLRTTDADLNEQQQMIKLFQRMMQNDIEFPAEVLPSLSTDCVDVLRRMLKTDPNQRATMADIQRHPWFLTALPEGAGLMNDLFLAEDAACLSPQSQSQIEALVALAAKLDEGGGAQNIRVQIPAAAAMSGGPQARVTAPSALPSVPPGLAAAVKVGAPQASRSVSAGGLGLNIVPGHIPAKPVPPPMVALPENRTLPGRPSYSAAGSPPFPSAPAPSPATSQQNRMSSGALGVAASPSTSVGSQQATQYPGGTLYPPGQSTASSAGAQFGAQVSGLPKQVSPPSLSQQQQQMAAQQQFLREFRAAAAAQQLQPPLHHQPPQQPQYHHPGSRPTLPPAPPPVASVPPPVGGQHHAYSPAMSPGGVGVPAPQMQVQGDFGRAPSGALSAGGAGVASSHTGNVAVGAPAVPDDLMGMGLDDMIPDLDEMVMNMPETELLAAATVDLRQPGPPQAQPRGSHGAGSMPPPVFASAYEAQQAAQQRHQAGPSGLYVRAPGSMSSAQGAGSMTGRSGSSITANVRMPPTELERQMMAGNMAASAGGAGGGAPGVIDASPFLYEGNDDDLPLVGSLSAFNPRFDWETFNSFTDNMADVQASQHFQASYFTRICQDVSAKMSDTAQRSPLAPPHGPAAALQQQMQAMGGLGGAGAGQQQAGTWGGPVAMNME